MQLGYQPIRYQRERTGISGFEFRSMLTEADNVRHKTGEKQIEWKRGFGPSQLTIICPLAIPPCFLVFTDIPETQSYLPHGGLTSLVCQTFAFACLRSMHARAQTW